jgi:hypothetical protein
MPRKRTHDEMATSEPPPEVKEQTMLQKLRSMWEFAAVMQYIYIFGKVVKIDEDFDIEVRYTPSTCPNCSLHGDGGVIPMLGIANLMVAGLRDGMHEAQLQREIGGDWPATTQMDLFPSRSQVCSWHTTCWDVSDVSIATIYGTSIPGGNIKPRRPR